MIVLIVYLHFYCWCYFSDESAEVESRKQGSRPRPKTQNNFEAKDTGASVLQKKGLEKIFLSDFKKRSSKIFFRQKRSSKFFFRRFSLEENKKGLRKFSARFLALSNKILTVKKIVRSLCRGQGNFRELEVSRPRTSKSVLEDVLEAKDVLKNSTSAN